MSSKEMTRCLHAGDLSEDFAAISGIQYQGKYEDLVNTDYAALFTVERAYRPGVIPIHRLKTFVR
jgi:hypothetical protein